MMISTALALTSINEIRQMILGVERRNSAAPQVNLTNLDARSQLPASLWLLEPMIHLLLPRVRGQCMCLRKMSKLKHACFPSNASSNSVSMVSLIIHVLSHNTTFQVS
jgi:hypothetical protein